MEHSIFEKIAGEQNTPAYIFDIDALKDRVNMITEVLKDSADVCFAMKANPFLVEPMKEYIHRFEVCSPGEYEICNRKQVNPDKIIISGVNKTEASMRRIIELGNGRGIFTIESLEHYRILKSITAKLKVNIKVIVRLSSGNQFGVDKDTLETIISDMRDNQYMKLHGLHFYSGTQKKLSKVEKEIAMLDEYSAHIKETYDIELEELEYGPGLSVTYFQSDKEIDAREQVEGLDAILKNVKAFKHVTVEMGRFIATVCGYFVTSVMDVKHTGEQNFCIIDGGIHQLNYYGQIMGMKQPYMELVCKNPGEEMQWNICGSLCTVNDVIVKGVTYPKMEIGDYFVFCNCGAYSVTEGMALFLSRELPQVFYYSDNNGLELVRKPMGTDILNS